MVILVGDRLGCFEQRERGIQNSKGGVATKGLTLGNVVLKGRASIMYRCPPLTFTPSTPGGIKK